LIGRWDRNSRGNSPQSRVIRELQANGVLQVTGMWIIFREEKRKNFFEIHSHETKPKKVN
ncbi:MAG: hypothetical protein P8Y63_09445, partial [Deltaproteobacteria bacterium]